MNRNCFGKDVKQNIMFPFNHVIFHFYRRRIGIVCFVSEGNDLYMTYTAYILVGIAGIIVLIRGINDWKRGKYHND